MITELLDAFHTVMMCEVTLTIKIHGAHGAQTLF